MKTDWKIPHSLQYENAVLGAALEGGFEEAVELGVQSDHFHGALHKKVWDAAVKLSEQNNEVNYLTVRDQSQGAGMLLNNLCSEGYPSSMLSYYYPKLEEVRVKRSVFERYWNALENFKEDLPSKELLNRLESDFYEVTKSSAGVRDQKTGWRSLVEVLEEASKGGLPSNGCKTGIGAIDAILRGFKPGSMNTIAARPGCGKSALAVQLMLEAAQRDDHVVYFTYEMPFAQIGERLLGNLTGEDIGWYKESGKGDIRKIATGASTLTRLPITIEDQPSINVNRIRSMARRLTKQKNVKLFIVDYLQIVPPAYRNQNKVVEVSEISRTLKMAAMETGVPFVTLSQMNRMIDMSDREPSLSDIRESGAIEQDSDSVSFLHQPDREDQTRVNFIVRKNRHGKTGKAELEWTRWNGRFRGVDKSHEQGDKSPI